MTPTARVRGQRFLSGMRIALSVSECDGPAQPGFDEILLSSTVLELAHRLLSEGATLVYGGHLGDEGYASRLAEIVRAHNAAPNAAPVERLENYVGWPVPFDADVVSRFRPVAKLVRVPRPVDVTEELHPDLAREPVDFVDAELSPQHRYGWARGMTEMRLAETAAVQARIVLGGALGPRAKHLPDGTVREGWYAGRIPGLLEEVMLSARANQPVFLIGAFGGVPQLVMDLIEGRDRPEMTWEYHRRAPHAIEMRALYEARGQPWWDYPEMAGFLRSRGLRGLNPLLTPDEHRELFAARHIEAILEMLLMGFARAR